jgi:Serine/threonine protein kinase
MPPSRRPDVSSVASPPRRSLTYDDLQIIDQLGGGGHASVYKAKVTTHAEPRLVAVKEPTHAERTLPAATAKEFIREAQTWRKLDTREREKQLYTDYEHLVGVVDTGEELPWIAMEYMDGGSLGDRLAARTDPYDIPELRWIINCIARGVELAHYEGISHLDLKPENVLFRTTEPGTWDVAKIGDWGTSTRPLEGSDDSGVSVAFSAPEQFHPDRFGEPDSMTDIYQVGAIIYTLAVGDPPYEGSQIEISQAVVDGPTAPSEHRSELPTELDQVVARAMAPDKQDRFRTIRDLAAAIADVPDPKAQPADGGRPADTGVTSDRASPVGGSQPGGIGGPTGPAGPTVPDQSDELDDKAGSPPEAVRTVELPPAKQPLEVIAGDEGYLVREYRRDPSEAAVFSRYERRMDAMRAASNRVSSEHHPCTLRWDTPDSVGDIYWNEHFESLRVEHSAFLSSWLVVPANDRFAFAAAPSAKEAYKRGKQIQQEYDFRELEICSRQGEVEKVVEHRFLRHSLTKSGVKFNR